MSSAGNAFALCPDSIKHIIDGYLAEYIPVAPDYESAVWPVLEVFCAQSTHLVVENNYFDIDYRSEYGITLPKSFTRRNPDVLRFHFFSCEDELHASSLLDFVDAAGQTSYLGYTIVRPQTYGLVGRSIIPPLVKADILAPSCDTTPLVRTAVSEPIQLFGVPLIATGVAFMEQDGHLMRCAHVSAWICHYTAFLRGLAPRRTTGKFHLAGAEAATSSRTYPSIGLTTSTLHGALRRLSLPPEIIGSETFALPRQITWADRAPLKQQLAALAEARKIAEDDPALTAETSGLDEEMEKLLAQRRLEQAKRDLDRFWIRENFSASVCRYLNSSTPSIFAREPEGHTQVAVGYIRNEDRSDKANDTSNPTAVSAFIVSDDNAGPFHVVDLDELVEEILYNKTFLLTPLPTSIWLSGDAAERAAIQWFSLFTPEAIRIEEAACNSSPCLDEFHAALKSFAAGITKPDADKFTVRSYLVSGADYKLDIRGRLARSPETVRAICEMQLPKYIWVTEVIDRDQRSGPNPVVASLGVDAGVATIDGDVPLDVVPLFIILPGRATVFDLLAPQAMADEASGPNLNWFRSQADPYPTGRWTDDWRKVDSPAWMAYHFKAATSDD